MAFCYNRVPKMFELPIHWCGIKVIIKKMDHCIMQFQRFDWLSGHGI